MVQINLSASIFLLVTTITSSLAYPVNTDAVELQEREPIRIGGAVKLLRHVAHHPHSRHIIKGAKGAARIANTVGQVSDAFQQNRREFDDEAIELVERDPRFGANHIRKFIHRTGGGHRMHRPHPSPPPTDDSSAPAARDLSEDELKLMAREPFFGVNHLKHWIGGKMHRHHHFNNGAQLSAAPNSAPTEAPAAREYEELLEREFFDDLD